MRLPHPSTDVRPARSVRRARRIALLAVSAATCLLGVAPPGGLAAVDGTRNTAEATASGPAFSPTQRSLTRRAGTTTPTPVPGPTPAPTPSPAPTPTPGPDVSTGQPRYLMWLATGTHPTSADIAAAAGLYSVVIFNSFQADLARQLRALDPAVVILTYVDLSSVRSYDGDKAVVTGVSYARAKASGWLAVDAAGSPITWGPYAGHYQTKVWDGGYQEAWTLGALDLVTSGPWDGVFADNDMITLGYYTDVLPAGVSTPAARDTLLTSGLSTLIAKAGPALNARGKLLVPNFGDSRQRLAQAPTHGAYGGVLEEMYLSWSRDGVPNIWDWGAEGWTALRDLVGTGRRTLAITQAAPTDHRTQLYGYGTFLLQADAGDAWMANTGVDLPPRRPPETGIALGRPLGPAVRVGGAWTRRFEGGWVAVNPARSGSLSVSAPAGARTVNGGAVSALTLGPMSAALVRL